MIRALTVRIAPPVLLAFLAVAATACRDGGDAALSPDDLSRISPVRGTRTDPERDPARLATLSSERFARITGRVFDAQTGRPTAVRVHVEDGGKTEAGAVLGGTGFWADGRYDVKGLPGGVSVRITGGRRRTEAVECALAKPGGRVKLDSSIGVPPVLKFEERRWYGLDLYRPVARGEAMRRRPTLDLLALAARGEGVRLCAAAAPWAVSGWRTGRWDLDALVAECAGLSREDFRLELAWPGMDAPFYGRAFFLGARSPRRLAPVGWDLRWPNFIAFEEARAQGAISILAGVAAPREMAPRGDVLALRPGLEEYYRDAAVALDGGAWELPFDVVSGALPDALALSTRRAEHAVWYRLLDMGYRIPSVHVETGSFGEGTLPAERTFVQLRPNEEFSLAAAINAIRAGRTMSTNGPFVFLAVDGAGPGSVIPADGAQRIFKFEAFSSTERGGEITALELVRNGKVIESVPGQGRSVIAAMTAVKESGPCWYIARARSGPEPGRLAWTSAVYFASPGAAPPRGTSTRVTGKVLDAATREPLSARVEARLFGRMVASARTDPATGAYSLSASPAARLDAVAPGRARSSVRVFFHTDAPAKIRSLHVNETGRGAAALAEERTYEGMRLACARAEIDFHLERDVPREEANP